jgi:hypothetical protein
MADHFVSLKRGVSGFKYSDFTTGTSSTGGNDVELRVADAANLTKLDVVKFSRLSNGSLRTPSR